MADLSADLVDLNSSRQAFQNCATIAKVDRVHIQMLAAPAHSFVQGTTSLVGMDHVTFQQFLDALSPQLTLTTDLTHRHQSHCQQVKLVRVANTHVHTLDDASKLRLKSRRVWIGIQDPTSPSCSIDDGAREALRLWAKLLVSTPFSLSMSPAAFLHITATADAMASQSMAGFGGAAFFPNGTCVWFQFQITLAQANEHWHWVGMDMHIAAWELLTQFTLTVCIESRLPRGRGPVACQQGTDNSAADAASAKGLSMTPAVSAVLAPYFKFMRRYHIFPKMTHVPGRLNVIADSLSRFKQPLPEPLTEDDHCVVRWQELLASSFQSVLPRLVESGLLNLALTSKVCCSSPLTVGSLNQFFVGEFSSPADRFSICVWCLFELPTMVNQFATPLLGMYIYIYICVVTLCWGGFNLIRWCCT